MGIQFHPLPPSQAITPPPLKMIYMLLLFLLAIHRLFLSADACAPPPPPLFSASPPDPALPTLLPPSRMPPSTAARVFGEQSHQLVGNGSPIQIEKANPLAGTPSPPIADPSDLNCAHFDEQCRWRNMEGLFIDELDWYQGAGFLDEARLKLATGTHIRPVGYYAIAATDKIEFPASKALLVSDVIECQIGMAELAFSYWTSPEVRIVVCTKSTLKVYPDYDYCAQAVGDGDPGPASISLPDLNGQSFQIYIRAENFVFHTENLMGGFVFHTENLMGGFAILDDIEYRGELCRKDTNGLVSLAEEDVQPLVGVGYYLYANFTPSLPQTPPPAPKSPLLPPLLQMPKLVHNAMDQLQLLSPTQETATNPSQRPLLFGTPTHTFQQMDAEPCFALNCSFNDHCSEYVLMKGRWKISSRPVGNPLTGIRGDASELPFNRDGTFVYALGPEPFSSRFSTRPFTLHRDAYLMFAYHKATRNAELRVIAKRADSAEEEVLFVAPKMVIQSRRWLREVRRLGAGAYEYIAFEVQSLPVNNYVGIDELVLLDGETREPMCKAPTLSVLTNGVE